MMFISGLITVHSTFDLWSLCACDSLFYIFISCYFTVQQIRLADGTQENGGYNAQAHELLLWTIYYRRRGVGGKTRSQRIVPLLCFQKSCILFSFGVDRQAGPHQQLDDGGLVVARSVVQAGRPLQVLHHHAPF
jgi:hypothetical protein